MAFRTTPQRGPALDAVIPAVDVWYDIPGKGTIGSPQLGTKEFGSDGREYIWVQAGGNIAATTQIALSAAFEATTGGRTGYFTHGTAVADGDFFWARPGPISLPGRGGLRSEGGGVG